MRVSIRSDYALRTVLELAARPTGEALRNDEIARAQGIPGPFLRVVVADLRRARIVRTQRGRGGGLRLARPPHEVTVADVVRAVDGPLVSIHDESPETLDYNDRARPLQDLWVAARDALREVLEGVTVADLALGELPDRVAARTESADAWRSH